ncbi:MAG: histidine kinase dimerization/phospho-acceptor domain-containing protein [Steroidobacteraceae bacterium]
MPDGVVVLNPHAEILWFNRMAGQLLALRKSDAGMRIENLVRDPEFVRYLRGGQYGAPVIVHPTVPGQHVAILVVPYGAGQFLLLVRDVTRQALLEDMRRDFVANASHELRSPLTVISGYLETLAQDPALDAELAAPLQEMRRQAERMHRPAGPAGSLVPGILRQRGVGRAGRRGDAGRPAAP